MPKNLKSSIRGAVCCAISAAMLLGALVSAYAAAPVSLADLVQAANALRTGEQPDADAMQKLDANGNGRIDLNDLVTLARQFTQGNSGDEPDTRWKEAYKEVVREEASHYSRPLSEVRFTLVDINNDDIPELVSESAIAAAGHNVYTYDSRDGVVTLHMSHWGFSFIPGADLICHNYGHQGLNNFTIYAIRNGEFVELAHGESNPATVGPLTFSWDGQECSQEQFYAQLDAIYDRTRAVNPFEADNGVLNWEQALQAIDSIGR